MADKALHTGRPEDVAEIEAIEHAMINAYTSGSMADTRPMDEVMKYFDMSDNLQIFDVILPLQINGGGAYRDHLHEISAVFPGHTDVLEMRIRAVDTLAFVTSIQRYTGTSPDGTKNDMTFRVTDGFEKVDGRWRKVHQHISVPVNLQTMTVFPNAR